MFTAEQVQAAISVVEGQRATAVEAAINLAMRTAELERALKAAKEELEALRSSPPAQ